MPIPLTPVIAAGGEVLSQGINAVIQSGENSKARRFANWQYDKQRADALADFNMQNEYNSPAAQMARLKAAGLNPNLVYGNGAASPSAAVRSSSMATPHTTAPRFDGGQIVSGFLNAQTQQLQADNLKAQNDVLLKQAKQIEANTLRTFIETNLKDFDLKWKNETKDILKEKLVASLHNITSGTDLNMAQTANTRERTNTELAMRAPRLNQMLAQTSATTQSIINMQLQGAKTLEETKLIYRMWENAALDGKLKQLDIDLKELGIQPGDNMFMRMLARFMGNQSASTPRDIFNPIQEAIDEVRKKMGKPRR